MTTNKSSFYKKFRLIMEQLNDRYSLVEDEKVTLMPGSFKPVTAEDLDAVKSYAEVSDRVIVIITDTSTKSISRRELSLSNLRELGSLKEEAEKLKGNLEHSLAYDIIYRLAEKAETISYSELKEGLKQILDSDLKDDDKYSEFISKIEKYLDYLEENLFSSVKHDADGEELTPEESKKQFDDFIKENGLENKVMVHIANSNSIISYLIDLINRRFINCRINFTNEELLDAVREGVSNGTNTLD